MACRPRWTATRNRAVWSNCESLRIAEFRNFSAASSASCDKLVKFAARGLPLRAAGRSTLFELLKLVHVTCALVSVAGFALRGSWVLLEHPLRMHPLARIVPHVVDTLLLGSALGMLWLWRLSPLQLDWVSAKIIALLLYIALGIGLMRFAPTRRRQWAFFVGALLCAGYIVAVAIAHSPRGPLALLGG